MPQSWEMNAVQQDEELDVIVVKAVFQLPRGREITVESGNTT